MAMRSVLITGALGEIGHNIVGQLTGQVAGDSCNRQHSTSLATSALSHGDTLVLLDRNPALPSTQKSPASGPAVSRVTCDITDRAALEVLFGRCDFTHVIHLAAILSTGGERDPLLAHRVNVEGSLYLLELARQQSARRVSAGGVKTKFIFPSSVAVYGVPSLEIKRSSAAVTEDSFLSPITMYGINKLYVEQLGSYYSMHFGALSKGPTGATPGLLDFRSIRFPGLLSADTVPTGGTSDYGPEMLHAAAQGKRYSCFVRPDATLPFMAMPDAVSAILQLLDVPEERLTRRAYNVSSFTVSADEIYSRTRAAFPKASVEFSVDAARQKIVDSWPAAMNDSHARSDWGWRPSLDIERTFSSYLIPSITSRYGQTKNAEIDTHMACGA